MCVACNGISRWVAGWGWGGAWVAEASSTHANRCPGLLSTLWSLHTPTTGRTFLHGLATEQ
jgi:hypothetical protein